MEHMPVKLMHKQENLTEIPLNGYTSSTSYTEVDWVLSLINCPDFTYNLAMMERGFFCPNRRLWKLAKFVTQAIDYDEILLKWKKTVLKMKQDAYSSATMWLRYSAHNQFVCVQ